MCALTLHATDRIHRSLSHLKKQCILFIFIFSLGPHCRWDIRIICWEEINFWLALDSALRHTEIILCYFASLFISCARLFYYFGDLYWNQSFFFPFSIINFIFNFQFLKISIVYTSTGDIYPRSSMASFDWNHFIIWQLTSQSSVAQVTRWHRDTFNQKY